MGLTANTRAQLVIEGIGTTEDLSNWEDDDWDQFALSCRRPGRILDMNGNLVNQAPFHLPLRSLKRLKEASNITRFYDDSRRPLTAMNLRYPVIDNFKM